MGEVGGWRRCWRLEGEKEMGGGDVGGWGGRRWGRLGEIEGVITTAEKCIVQVAESTYHCYQLLEKFCCKYERGIPQELLQ